jgi:hypothetical protein
MENEKENPEGYNGWPNRETWAYFLNLTNDEGLYNTIHERAQDIINKELDGWEIIQDSPDTPITEQDKDELIHGINFQIAEMLKEFVEELREYLEAAPEGSEQKHALLNIFEDVGSFWRVDYLEIARAEFSDDIKTEMESREWGKPEGEKGDG